MSIPGVPSAKNEFEFTTLPPQITFQRRDVPPPSALYVGPDDRLIFQVANSAAGAVIWLQLRLLFPDGRIGVSAHEFRPTADRAVNTYYVALTEAFLLAATCVGNPAGPPGSCWVRGVLGRTGPGAPQYQHLLLCGYLVTMSALTWPYPRFGGQVEGPGWVRLIEGTDPAAGASISETVPTAARWRVMSVFCWLATSAVAGDRSVYLQFTAPSGLWLRIPPQVLQPGSNTYYYSWFVGGQQYAPVIVGMYAFPLPADLYLAAGQIFQIQAGGMDGGDNFGPPRYLVEEWIET